METDCKDNEISTIKSPRLHEALSPEQIEELYTVFHIAKLNKFSRQDFQDVLKKFNMVLGEEQFNTLFLKV